MQAKEEIAEKHAQVVIWKAEVDSTANVIREIDAQSAEIQSRLMMLTSKRANRDLGGVTGEGPPKVDANEFLTHTLNALRDFDYLDPTCQHLLRRFVDQIEAMRVTANVVQSPERFQIASGTATPVGSIAGATSDIDNNAAVLGAEPIKIDGELAGEKRKRDTGDDGGDCARTAVSVRNLDFGKAECGHASADVMYDIKTVSVGAECGYVSVQDTSLQNNAQIDSRSVAPP